MGSSYPVKQKRRFVLFRPVTIELMKGTVVYLYAFDIANEIKTGQVRELLSEKLFPFQIRVGVTAPKDVPIYSPLTLALKPMDYDANVGHVTLKPFVKIFDVGAISISYEVPFEVESLGALVPYHQLMVGKAPLAAVAERLAIQVAEALRPHLVKPNPDRTPVEAYTSFCFSDVGTSVPDWVRTHRSQIAGLLNEESEPGKLAERQV